MTIDDVRDGFLQKLRRAPAWQVGGIILAASLVYGTALNSVAPLPAQNYFWPLWLVIEAAVAYQSVSRENATRATAAWAAGKAALIGIVPELLLALFWAANIAHPTILGMYGRPHIQGRYIVDLCIRSEAAVTPLRMLLVLPAAFFPALVVGAIAARFARPSLLAQPR